MTAFKQCFARGYVSNNFEIVHTASRTVDAILSLIATDVDQLVEWRIYRMTDGQEYILGKVLLQIDWQAEITDMVLTPGDRLSLRTTTDQQVIFELVGLGSVP